MKVVALIVLVIAAIVGYHMYQGDEAKREIKAQRAAMTAVKSFHTSVTMANNPYITGYEGDAVCPDKLHFTLHAAANGVIADGSEYIKVGSFGYLKSPTGDWTFANMMSYIPDPCQNAANDPTGRSAKSDALEDTAAGTKGDWRTVNAESCMQWSFSIPVPNTGTKMEYTECIGADHLPREFKSLDGSYTAYYSHFGEPFMIEKPQVQITVPKYPQYPPNTRQYEPAAKPKPSPDPEVPY